MKKSFAAAVGLIMIVGSSAFAAAPPAKENLQKEAKISMADARKIAMTKEPKGKVESEELEREHGKLIYSFDIRNPKGTITEVAVSAIDGKIVSVEHENKAKEAAEKKQEAKEKAAKKH
ncbi:MAG: peptidase [Acidobacteria bacterium]|nr:peptidase [Acidobacteriota bacterium]